MPTLPLFLPIAFIAVVAYALWCFARACNGHRRTFIVIGTWMLVTAVLSLAGFFAARGTTPPRPVFLLGPAVLFVIGLFATRAGRVYIDGLRPSSLVLLHTVRIPVELVLLANVSPEDRGARAVAARVEQVRGRVRPRGVLWVGNVAAAPMI